MGCICSCLCLEDLEEYVHSDASMNRQCSCFRFLAQQLIHLYTALLQREEVQSIPLVEQGMDSSASTMDNSVHDIHHFPSRPQPHDDPRISRMECDGLISRQDDINHLHEESEPLRGSNNDASMELSTTIKCSGSNYEVAPKLCCSKSDALAKVRYGVRHSFPPYEDEDEDVCPTCLEEYTPENPRIETKCFHHFHLGCIYEWKERSELCPVCGKTMVFDET